MDDLLHDISIYHSFLKRYICGKKKVKVSAHTYKKTINSKNSALNITIAIVHNGGKMYALYD